MSTVTGGGGGASQMSTIVDRPRNKPENDIHQITQYRELFTPFKLQSYLDVELVSKKSKRLRRHMTPIPETKATLQETFIQSYANNTTTAAD